MARGSRPRGGDATAGTPRGPVRTCVACRSARPQRELVRLAARDGRLVLDPSFREPGRGAYLCPSQPCWERAATRDGALLRRALRLPTLDVGPTLAAAPPGGPPASRAPGVVPTRL